MGNVMHAIVEEYEHYTSADGGSSKDGHWVFRAQCAFGKDYELMSAVDDQPDVRVGWPVDMSDEARRQYNRDLYLRYQMTDAHTLHRAGMTSHSVLATAFAIFAKSVNFDDPTRRVRVLLART